MVEKWFEMGRWEGGRKERAYVTAPAWFLAQSKTTKERDKCGVFVPAFFARSSHARGVIVVGGYVKTPPAHSFLLSLFFLCWPCDNTLNHIRLNV